MKKLHVTWESKEEQVLIKSCFECYGTGIRAVANGEDDTDHDFCNCIKGDAVFLEAQRLTAHND